MSRANLKLTVSFEFELDAPDALLARSQDQLLAAVQEMLGAMVLQGMPTVTTKQLAKAGVGVLAHRAELDVINTIVAQAPREALIAAAPHLTDGELGQLARRTGGKVPLSEAERFRFLRRQALAFVGEFRMLPCVIHARLVSGKDAQLAGRLNLTNGSVLVGERDRQSRLQVRQEALRVTVEPAGVSLAASCAGHTLSGPVIEVAVADLATHRDALIAAWQNT